MDSKKIFICLVAFLFYLPEIPKALALGCKASSPSSFETHLTGAPQDERKDAFTPERSRGVGRSEVGIGFEDIKAHEAAHKKNVSITILGTGYVGLVTGACLAEFGHRVICADTDHSKIEMLNQSRVPIYEPGLKELIIKNVTEDRLFFTTDINGAIAQSECIFIAVGTPMGLDGCADLSALYSAFSMIIPHLQDAYKLICIKSTVPIGTGKKLQELLLNSGIPNEQCDLVSNPEFLREGSAIHDFMNPDRVVVGAHCERAQKYMQDIYGNLIEQEVPCLFTNIVSAETIKYASNAFLATKLGFVNEMANLCDQTGADIFDVALGMGLDNRIGQAFLKPGPGFGGSCFPKDCHALLAIAKNYDTHLNVVYAVLASNEEQQKKPVQKLLALMNNDITGKTIAVLGLAFKKNTDDIRHSPVITTLELLLQKGAYIKAYDPAAMPNMHKLFPHISYENCPYDAARNAHAVIIMTEWDEFKEIDLERLGALMKSRILVDARNLLKPEDLRKYGFSYAMMGRH